MMVEAERQNRAIGTQANLSERDRNCYKTHTHAKVPSKGKGKFSVLMLTPGIELLSSSLGGIC